MFSAVLVHPFYIPLDQIDWPVPYQIQEPYPIPVRSLRALIVSWPGLPTVSILVYGIYSVPYPFSLEYPAKIKVNGFSSGDLLSKRFFVILLEEIRMGRPHILLTTIGNYRAT